MILSDQTVTIRICVKREIFYTYFKYKKKNRQLGNCLKTILESSPKKPPIADQERAHNHLNCKFINCFSHGRWQSRLEHLLDGRTVFVEWSERDPNVTCYATKNVRRSTWDLSNINIVSKIIFLLWQYIGLAKYKSRTS